MPANWASWRSGRGTQQSTLRRRLVQSYLKWGTSYLAPRAQGAVFRAHLLTTICASGQMECPGRDMGIELATLRRGLLARAEITTATPRLSSPTSPPPDTALFRRAC